MKGIRLRLRSDGLHGKNTKVWLDDVEMSGIISEVKVRWNCADVNRAEITFLCSELDLDTEVLRVLDRATLRPGGFKPDEKPKKEAS